MMVKIDPEILATTSSATLILVRAELWHYAWEKVGNGLIEDWMDALDSHSQSISFSYELLVYFVIYYLVLKLLVILKMPLLIQSVLVYL